MVLVSHQTKACCTWDQLHSLFAETGSYNLRYDPGTSVAVAPYNNSDTGFRILWTGYTSNPPLYLTKFNGIKCTFETSMAYKIPN